MDGPPPPEDLENGTIAEDSVGGVTQTTLGSFDIPPPPDDWESGTVEDSVGGVTRTTLDEDEEQVHDQLPSVEEYKTHMNSAPSPSKSPAAVAAEVFGDDDDDDDGRAHDLPTVDEYKASTGTVTQSASSSSFCGRCCWTLVAILFVGAIAAAIVIPIAMNSDGEGTRQGLFSRRKKVVNFLVSQGISDETKLNTPGTPQYEAALWISDHDAFRMPMPESDSQQRRFVERYALAVFFYATGGPRWRYDANFLSASDVCDWNGVTLSPGTGEPVFLGVTGCKALDLDGDGIAELYARDIFLFGNRMDGTIPDEIERIERLEILSVFANPGLTGEFIDPILNLKHMQDLEFQYCAISGVLPTEIGKMSALTNLGLSNNLFVGTIPDSLFDLTDLEWLFIDDNIMEGDVSGFGRLTSLYGLYAEDTGLYGQLTSDMINGWKNMYELDLSTNLITGTIPQNLLNHDDMVIVDLHENKFTGSIPDIQGKNTALKFLALYSNSITGTIPPSIGNIENLVHLDLGINDLVLPMPAELGDLTHLRYLFTNNNNFGDHDFPGFVKKLTNLRELSLKDNSITGTIPSSLASLDRLVLLDLDRNKFQGSIPEEIAHMTNLAFLFLNRNQLTGTLPSSMTTMYTLSAVLLDGNNFSGNADVICTDPLIDVSYFSSDCLGPNPEFECSCCSVCCNDANVTCNNFEWTLNLDAIWEYGHSRRRWSVDWTLLADEEEEP